jgi:hypothetical protein
MTLCPRCGGNAVEIFSTEGPIGYTGIYQCLACNRMFDPTFPDFGVWGFERPNPYDDEIAKGE